jgi:hypothetical protein
MIQYFKALSHPLTAMQSHSTTPNFDVMFQAHRGAIGVPGSLEGAARESLTAIHQILCAFLDQWASMFTIAPALTYMESSHSPACQAHLKALQPPVVTLLNLGDLLSDLSRPTDPDAARFTEHLGELSRMRAENLETVRAFRREFDSILTLRDKTGPARAKLRVTAQASIDVYRSAMSGLAQAFRERNSVVRQLFLGLGTGYRRIAGCLRDGASKIESSAVVDFDSDFGTFLSERRVVRFDLMDLPFQAYPTWKPGFKGLNTKIYVELSPVYQWGSLMSSRTTTHAATTR